jgi:hypothetical protein
MDVRRLYMRYRVNYYDENGHPITEFVFRRRVKRHRDFRSVSLADGNTLHMMCYLLPEEGEGEPCPI